MNSTGAEMLERAHAPNQGEYIDVIEHRKGQGEYIDVIEYRMGKPTPTITDVKGNHRRCITSSLQLPFHETTQSLDQLVAQKESTSRLFQRTPIRVHTSRSTLETQALTRHTRPHHILKSARPSKPTEPLATNSRLSTILIS